MKQRTIALAVGAVLLVVALALSIWPFVRAGRMELARAEASAQEQRRRVVIDATERGESLQLRFTRPNGAVGDLQLVRQGPGSAWVPQTQVEAPGLIFGDGYPIFATPRFLAVYGIDLMSVLRPMSPEIANEHADEVTIIRGWGGEIAVCLWHHDKITRAYLAGGVFEALLRASEFAPACDAIEALAIGAARGELRTAAWAATLAGCAARRTEALEALRRDCDAGEATACDLLLARAGSAAELWPEIDDCWCWVLDVLDAVRLEDPAARGR